MKNIFNERNRSHPDNDARHDGIINNTRSTVKEVRLGQDEEEGAAERVKREEN